MDNISNRLIAENKIEEYLNFLNDKYFQSIVFFPTYEKEEKISLVKDLENQFERNLIPYRKIYELVKPDRYIEREIFLQVMRNETMEFDCCYIVKYQTNLFIETKNPTTKPLGYGNFLVDKNNLNVFILPSSMLSEFWAKEYSRHLKKENKEIDFDWKPLNLNERIIRFRVSGPIQFKS